MSEDARVLQVAPAEHRERLAAHVQHLRKETAVIFVCHAHTAEQWRELIGAGEDVFYIDATGHGPPGISYGPDVHYIDSPVKLELTALVMERVCRRLGSAHVVLEDLAACAAITGPEPTLEFTHLLVNRNRQKGRGIDFVLTDGPSAQRLLPKLAGMTGTPTRLEAP